MRIVYICAALAAGEGLAAELSTGAEAWPLLAILATLTALFGYGYGLKGWRYLFAFLIGVALFWHGTVEAEQEYRNSPWMRGARRHVRHAEEGPRACAALRRDLSRRIGLGLEHDAQVAALNRAILLGSKSDMPARARRVFVESGTIHVFAISGLHVMVVARVLVFMMAVLFVPLRWQGVLALVPLWGYVLLVGAAPSAVRAAAMATLYYGATAFCRRPDAVAAWALTFLAVHVWRPAQIADVGSLFSFAVMLALVLVGRAARNLGAGWRQTLLLSLAAWAAGVPIAAHVFGRITPGALVANLVLVPAAGCSVACGVLGVFASCVSPTLAAHVNNVSGLFTDAMVCVAECVARVPGASIEVPPWPLTRCLAWYLAMILGGVLVRLRRGGRILI